MWVRGGLCDFFSLGLCAISLLAVMYTILFECLNANYKNYEKQKTKNNGIKIQAFIAWYGGMEWASGYTDEWSYNPRIDSNLC